IPRAGEPDQRGQPEAAACAGDDGEPGFGEADNGAVREDAEGELEAAAEGEGGERGEGGDWEGGEEVEGAAEGEEEGGGSVCGGGEVSWIG
ncbi:MAG: hypothetical protein Q9157_008917, partial [Trypethelium eluteriae]